MKLERVIPPETSGVQFGLGHDCCARKSDCDGALCESGGTVSLPFLLEVSGTGPVVELKVPWCCESDRFPPPFLQTMVAEYVALKVAVASMWPTPASWYEVVPEGVPPHLTVVPETVQVASVPPAKCVPFGAAAGLIVLTMAA